MLGSTTEEQAPESNSNCNVDTSLPVAIPNNQERHQEGKDCPGVLQKDANMWQRKLFQWLRSPIDALLKGKRPLPKLDPALVQVIPAAVAEALRVIPVDGKPERLVLVCAKALSKEQKATLDYMCPGREFVLVADPEKYTDVRVHLDALIAHYYPPERKAINCSTLKECTLVQKTE